MKPKLFEHTLPKKSLNLIEKLNDEIKKNGFYLGGGSGLSLQIGHRISEDLDFFTNLEFKPEILSRYLERIGDYKETSVSFGTLYCTINGVKLSFIFYNVLLVYPLINFKKIRVTHWKDILAEKFKTLSQRGSRKDFYDIYLIILEKKLTITDVIKIFKNRFKNTNINYYHILKSLTYFKEADNEPDLLLLKDVPWKTVKSFFTKNIKEFETAILKGTQI